MNHAPALNPPAPAPLATITLCLDRIRAGETAARDELWTAVHGELRRMAGGFMAGEAANTLQPTALVHEVFLRLNDSDALAHGDRRYFFAAAATSMRRILIERARRMRRSREHAVETPGMAGMAISSGRAAGSLIEAAESRVEAAESLVEIDRVLDAFTARYPAEQEIVVLRVFGGRSIDEIADLLELSPSTVKRRWRFAAAWLRRAMSPQTGVPSCDAA